MLKAWSSGSRITDELLNSYLDAVEDVSAEAVGRSCEQFRKGLVDGHNTEFAPAPASLAKNARAWDAAIASITSSRELAKIARIVTYPIGELPPPGFEPLGPTKIEVDGVPRDVTSLSFAAKEEILKTGKMPEDDSPAIVAKIRKM